MLSILRKFAFIPPLVFMVPAAVQAGSVDGEYDLKSSFGASGSQQTMTCTATASSDTLNCRTLADFKAGQNIFLPAAGYPATIATPAPPDPICRPSNGASCTGTTVYCYKLAGIQGVPNGAVSAASAEGCSTQATQTWPALYGTRRPAVTTTFTIPTVRNVSLWIVYESIDGRPYIPIALAQSGAFIDSGNWTPILFKCGDESIPCSPPTSPVNDDVYATITNISGSNVTIGPWSAPPRFYFRDGLAAETYPSRPQVSGTFIVQHDDTGAFYAAGEAVRHNRGTGQLTLHAPAGKYNIHAADPYGHVSVMHLNEINNLTIEGDGDSTYFYQQNDRGGLYPIFLTGVCGYNDREPAGNCATYLGLENHGIGYALVDPVTVGSNSAILVTPSEASNLKTGGYVVISTGNGNTYPLNTYGELNKIASINSTSGLITFTYPITKTYSANLGGTPYEITYGIGSYHPDGTPTISPISPNSAAVATHIVLKDFQYFGPNKFLHINTIDYFDEDHLNITCQQHMASGAMRHLTIAHNKLTEDGFMSRGTMLAEFANGDVDGFVYDNTYTNQHWGANPQVLSEGAANVFWWGNTFNISGFQQGAIGVGAPTFFTCAGGCWNSAFLGNVVNIRNAHFWAVLSSDRTGRVIYAGNKFNIDAIGPSGSVVNPKSPYLLSSTTETEANNKWNSGRVYPVSNGNGDIPGFGVVRVPAASGALRLQSYTHSHSILKIPLSGNVTQVNLGSTRVANLLYILAVQQPSMGGPYTLPSGCGSTYWVTGGNALDCPSGVPILNPASGSYTYLWFFDDGTTVHFLWSDYPTT